MPNNPVQIILNDRDFHQAPEPGQAPRNKDFFEGEDEAFARHKRAMLAAIDTITAEVRQSPHGPATYLKIQMRNEALAKSYRPVHWLFVRDQFPCVGADAVGTLYFRAPLIYLAGLRHRIAEAEDEVETKYRLADGEPYKAPSIARAEVGAIEQIEIAPPDQKRSFPVAAAVASFDDPRTVSGYHIELFETPEERVIADDPIGRRALQQSLERVLHSLAGARTYVALEIGRTPVLELQLTESDQAVIVDNRSPLVRGGSAPSPPTAAIDRSVERHEAALNALQQHPLVRAILPPVMLQITDEPPAPSGFSLGAEPLRLTRPQSDSSYPIVGVIDTGVAPILEDWVIGRFDYLSTNEYDPAHGTGVAGLLAFGQLVNGVGIAPEANGCRIYDVPLYPKGTFLSKYRRGFSDFLEEIEQAVREAKESFGVRIFNLSINAISDVERTRYSIYASRLDQIADTYGVLFVNSAGNLTRSQVRAPWPKRPGDVVKYFATRQAPDTIYKPTESVRSISVGALNPPNSSQVDEVPTVYTTRGPGLQVGVKPDVATYGGTGGVPPGTSTGLASIAPDGNKLQVVGTSFAAPLVARALAGLDTATEGGLNTETLRAMLLHHAKMPAELSRRGLKELARQFAGFGRPVAVDQMLQTDDHQITLLFQSRLSIGERKPVILRFPFTWPTSLVNDDGECSGRVRMTLVYSPPLDPAFGAEFVRVNLEASLKQRQLGTTKKGAARYANQIAARYLPKPAPMPLPERALIDHGLKWWPSKQYESTLVDCGASSQWRLEVTSLVRAEAQFPAEGVPFAVLLTLEDPEGKRPVFQQMRQALQASKAQAIDVRTVSRVRVRR